MRMGWKLKSIQTCKLRPRVLQCWPVTDGFSSPDDPGGDRAAHFHRGRRERSLTHVVDLHHLRHVHAAGASILQCDLNADGLHRPHFPLQGFAKAVTLGVLLVNGGRALSFRGSALPRHPGGALVVPGSLVLSPQLPNSFLPSASLTQRGGPHSGGSWFGSQSTLLYCPIRPRQSLCLRTAPSLCVLILQSTVEKQTETQIYKKLRRTIVKLRRSGIRREGGGCNFSSG